ncbi:RNA polymerase sigma factor [Plantactinospora siamensis]|uniref:RNA polymerase sigma factor n=1 Tax=Plantactinospora siamensis TaxID=555372 RepID=A0ABV6P4M2_9ACTN
MTGPAAGGSAPPAGPDASERALVLAARNGDRAALDTLGARSLPLVYAIVGPALHRHADVDDVAQEALLRVIGQLGELPAPDGFRTWLAAITLRQIREHESRRRLAAARTTELDRAREVADPGADFVAAVILRLGLTDQRRELAAATRWLDPDDRTVLALWWLAETGALTRSELAAALEISPATAAVRVRRMKDQLRIGRGVARALGSRPGCPRLTGVGLRWDGRPSPLWRKRFGRHVRDCAGCAGAGADLLPVDRLVAVRLTGAGPGGGPGARPG